jgi:hypothetical protein
VTLAVPTLVLLVVIDDVLDLGVMPPPPLDTYRGEFLPLELGCVGQWDTLDELWCRVTKPPLLLEEVDLRVALTPAGDELNPRTEAFGRLVQVVQECCVKSKKKRVITCFLQLSAAEG